MNGQTLAWLVTVCSIALVQGQHNEVCYIFGTKATCRYRVDGVCMSLIGIEVKPCANPVAAQFTIKCSRPYVDFSHTFSGRHSVASVPGYSHEVQLIVDLGYITKNKIVIQADLQVYGKPKVDLVHQELDLSADKEHCLTINHAAIIALSVMGALLLVVIVMVIILIRIWRKRKNRRRQRNNGGLVQNEEHTAGRTPVASYDNVCGHMSVRYNVDAEAERPSSQTIPTNTRTAVGNTSSSSPNSRSADGEPDLVVCV